MGRPQTRSSSTSRLPRPMPHRPDNVTLGCCRWVSRWDDQRRVRHGLAIGSVHGPGRGLQSGAQLGDLSHAPVRLGIRGQPSFGLIQADGERTQARLRGGIIGGFDHGQHLIGARQSAQDGTQPVNPRPAQRHLRPAPNAREVTQRMPRAWRVPLHRPVPAGTTCQSLTDKPRPEKAQTPPPAKPAQ
jgi:hypothetical protein